MIRYYRILNEGSVEPQEGLVGADWIHLEAPDKQEMTRVAEEFRFPLDYLLSTLDPDEVSRAEQLEQTKIVQPVLVSLLYPLEPEDRVNEGVYEDQTLSVILLDKQIVTCVRKNPDFLDHLLESEFELVKRPINERCLLIEIAWQVTRAYVYASRDISARMDQIHKQLRASSKSELLLLLADLDKSTIYLSTAVAENHPILRTLSVAPYLTGEELRREWIHDVLVENHQAEKMLDQTRQMLQQLDTTFSSIIQNNLNETMKKLTSLTIIITIPCITAGLWGMNVALPFSRDPLAFLVVLAITSLLMLLAYLWLKRKDFL